MSCLTCKYVIGLTILAIGFIIVSGLINATILMSLADTITGRDKNMSSLLNQTILCEDPLSLLCSTSNQFVKFYNESGNFSFTFYFGWALTIVIIEIVKFVIILSFAYALYRIYLRQYMSDLVTLFPKVSSLTEESNEYNIRSDEEIELDFNTKAQSPINFEDTSSDSL